MPTTLTQAELHNSVGQTARTYWLGVDGGGTYSRAAIADATGKQIGEGHAEAANPLRVGVEAAITNIKQAVQEACNQAEITPAQVTAACFGLAGVGNAKHYQTMLAALRQAFPFEKLTLETDARIALAGATDLQPGIVVIAGTGSIACGINAAGEFARAGGWGPAMGDEGSGYYIGRRALQAVVMAYDGRAAATSLTGAVCEYFKIAAPTDLPPVIYERPLRVMREIAQLSKIVAAHAQAGDQVARAILLDAAAELARAANAVIKKLGLQDTAFRLAYVGGVFGAGELILAPLRQFVQGYAPAAELAPPLMPPVSGAVKLARSLHG
jgi:N-acetylglucosamine kinase-like BadF-type ATPase